jgi:hypothetical protein
MGWRVEDVGKSECQFIPKGHKYNELDRGSDLASHRKMAHFRLVSRHETAGQTIEAGKQMTADFGRAGAPVDGNV